MIHTKNTSVADSLRMRWNATFQRRAGVIVAIACLAVGAGAPAEEIPAGQWLFDHAAIFTLGLTEPTPADAEYVLIWLDAAIELSPDLAEAHRQKADLLIALDRTDEATRSLEAYCKLAPDDLDAAVRLTDLKLDKAQTVEDRIASCEAILKESGSARPEFRSDLNRRLAELHASRDETDLAKQHAREAIQLYAGNFAAKTLLATIEGKLDDPATRIELLLAEVASNPVRSLALLNLARTLEALGDYDAATTWYKRTADSLEHFGDSQGAFDIRIELALCHLDNEHYESCLELCNRLLETDPASAPVEMLLIRAARATGNAELADRHTVSLSARLRERYTVAVEKEDYDAMLRMAEYQLDIAGDASAAVEASERAALYVPDLAQPLVGWSLVAAREFKKALPPLEPLAANDQRSALELARAQIALDDLDVAKKTLRMGEKLRFAGPSYHAIVDMLAEMKETPIAKPDLAAIGAVLSRFDARVLDFPAHAGEFVKFDAALDATSYAFGRPINATLAIENKAPFTLQFGIDRMVDARVGVSLADTVRHGPKLKDYLDIPFDRKLSLAPGERVELPQRIDTAVARMVLTHQPQNRRVFDVTFTLDPNLLADGDESCLSGVAPITNRFTRLAVDGSAKGIEKLTQTLESGTETERFAAIEKALALIHERLEAFQDKPHTYAAATVDPAVLEKAIVGALKDAAPAVRARALWALAYVKLDEAAINAAAPLIQDPHWLPRLLAIEMFAKHQGPVFLPVLKAKSDDSSPLVARLATLYIQQLSSDGGVGEPSLP